MDYVIVFCTDSVPSNRVYFIKLNKNETIVDIKDFLTLNEIVYVGKSEF